MKYTITENAKFGSLEITFPAKPDEATRDALKALKFRWNGKRGLWYCFATVEAVKAALEGETAQEAQTGTDAGKKPQDAPKAAKKDSRPDQDRIRIYYNGIKLDGGPLVGCWYSLNNHRDYTDCVSISAKGYGGQLPRDLLPVTNDTDLYSDYHDTDRATITPEHPLYKYFRYAAMKDAARDAARHIEFIEKRTKARPDAVSVYASDLERDRARIEAFKAERDPGQPTAADLEAIDRQRQEAENARREAEHKAQLEARENFLRQRSEGREYIESIMEAYPIREGQPTVEIPFSENPAFYSWTESQDKTVTTLTINADGTQESKTEVIEPRRRLILSVAAAEIVLDHFDKLRHLDGAGYDKTDFVIKYTDIDTGEPSTYTGRYDLGDRDGGLIAHIRAFGEYYRTHDNFGHQKPEPDEAHPAIRVADFLSSFCAPGPNEEIIQTDEIHHYRISGEKVQLFELMGGRWCPLGPAENWSKELIDELRESA